MDTSEKRIEMNCPLNGKVCIGGVRSDFEGVDKVGNKLTCRWWTHVKGQHPQEDRSMDHYDCAVAWIPVTVLEVSKQSRSTSAEVHNIVNGIAAILPAETRKHYIAATGGAVVQPTLRLENESNNTNGN